MNAELVRLLAEIGTELIDLVAENGGKLPDRIPTARVLRDERARLRFERLAKIERARGRR